MGETACAADTAADTRHTLDKVIFKDSARRFQKSRFAFFYAVTRKRINGEIYILLLNCLADSLRNAAASCKYSAVIGSIVKNILRKLGKLDITRIYESLKLLKGENAVDILCDSFLLRLGFFLPYKGL